MLDYVEQSNGEIKSYYRDHKIGEDVKHPASETGSEL